jgi:hypothetical protein
VSPLSVFVGANAAAGAHKDPLVLHGKWKQTGEVPEFIESYCLDVLRRPAGDSLFGKAKSLSSLPAVSTRPSGTCSTDLEDDGC